MRVAWDIAAYAIALCATVAAGVTIVIVWRIGRLLRRMEQKVTGLADKADAALDEMIVLTQSVRSTVQSSSQVIDGFAHLAKGARVIGEAAESAAEAIVHTASFWRDRLLSIAGNGQAEEGSDRASSGLTDLVRYAGHLVFTRMSEGHRSSAHRHVGADADSHQGE